MAIFTHYHHVDNSVAPLIIAGGEDGDITSKPSTATDGEQSSEVVAFNDDASKRIVSIQTQAKIQASNSSTGGIKPLGGSSVSNGPASKKSFSVKVWDIFSMKLTKVFHDHTDTILAIATHQYFPYIVSGDGSGWVHVWNPIDDENVKEAESISKIVLPGERVKVHSISIVVESSIPSQQSVAIVIASSDKKIFVYDQTLVLFWHFTTDHTDMLLSVTTLVMHDRLNPMKTEGKNNIPLLIPSTQTTSPLSQSPGKKEEQSRQPESTLSKSSKSNKSGKNNSTDLKRQESALKNKLNWFERVMIISASWDKTVHCWQCSFDYDKQQVTTTCDILCGHTKSVTAITACHIYGSSEANSANRSMSLLISGSLDKTCVVWDLEKREKLRILSGHREKITATTVILHGSSSTGNVKDNNRSSNQSSSSPPLLITASEDKLAVIWDLLTGYALRRFQHLNKVIALDACLLPEGLMIVTGESTEDIIEKQPLHVWNMLRRKRYHRCETESDVVSLDTICTFPQPVATHKSSQHLHSHHSCSETEHVIDGTIVVGSIDGWCRMFDIVDRKMTFKLPVFTKETSTRVNRVLFYKPHPWSINQSVEEQNPWLIVAEGEAKLSIWDFVAHKKLKALIGHTKTLFAISIFEPHLLSKKKITACSKSTFALNLHKPWLVTGGFDEQICIWDVFDGSIESPNCSPSGSDSFDKCAPYYSLKKAHSGPIRSLTLHYNQTEGTCYLITGSYDKTTVLWDLQTMEKKRVFKNAHESFIFAVAVYDPIIHCGVHGNIKRPDGLHEEPILITGGYDGCLIFYNLFKENEVPSKKDPSIMIKTNYLQKVFAHTESITAMSLYTPRLPKDDPLVVTGSIDTKVIVWNVFTGERMQTLIGHSNRVSFISLLVFPSDPCEPNNPHDKGLPLLITGGDDQSIIIWEDALHQRKFMPTSDGVNAAFRSDLQVDGNSNDDNMGGGLFDHDDIVIYKPHQPASKLDAGNVKEAVVQHDWPLITRLVQRYKHQVFVENPSLFSSAIDTHRPDFLLKFRSYLTYLIRFLPNLLKEAIDKNDLISVRIILLCWLESCNRDIEDRLEQRLFHASYFLPTEHLKSLAAMYPLEFVNFISGLSLVRNLTSLIDESHINQKLSLFDRMDILGMDDPSAEYDTTWKHVFEERSDWLDNWHEIYEVLLYERCSNPQSVTSLMIPLTNAASIQMLELFVEVSNLLNNFDIFDSPIGSIALKYYWDTHGKRLHLIAIIKYFMCMGIFLFCLYSFEFYFHTIIKEHSNNSMMISRIEMNIVNIIVIIIFIYYLFEEIIQCIAKYRTISNKIASKMFVSNSSDNMYRVIPLKYRESTGKLYGDDKTKAYIRVGAFIISHFILDIWNAIDMSIILTGIVGLVMRMIWNDDSSGGRVVLSITSILMWFKILYFMRPFSASGQLGKLQLIERFICITIYLICFNSK